MTFNMAFHLLQIWPQTLVAIDSESQLTLFPSFFALPSEVAELLNSNLSRHPLCWQAVYSDLLLSTGFDLEHVVCSYVIFLLRDQRMIERLSKVMGAALICNNFSPIPSKFHSHKKKKWLVAAQNLQSIKTFLTLDLSQYSKSGSMFSSSKPVAAHSDCSQLGNSLCLCSPVQPAYWGAQPKQESSPKSLAVDFPLFSFDSLLEQPSERLPDDLQGLKLGLKLELCCLTNKLQRFCSLWNHRINCVEFQFFLSLLLMPNLSQESKVLAQHWSNEQKLCKVKIFQLQSM